MSIKHAHQTALPDSGDDVSATAWNAAHTIDAGTITDTEVAAANKDGTTSTASMRTLGTGSQQAAAGDHGHATLAPLASPTFTGTPAAPTATAGTNTTQIATTAFVTTAVAAVSGGGITQGQTVALAMGLAML